MLLEILSPEASLFKGEITSVSVPGLDGSFQILNNHYSFIITKGNGKYHCSSLEFSKGSCSIYKSR
jgi:F-type H+-transporting ATPase subunit epsilon